MLHYYIFIFTLDSKVTQRVRIIINITTYIYYMLHQYNIVTVARTTASIIFIKSGIISAVQNELQNKLKLLLPTTVI